MRPDSTVLFVLRPRFYVIWPSRAPGWKNTARNQGLQKHSPKPKGWIQTLGGLWDRGPRALGREGLVGQGILPQGRPRVRKQPAPSFLSASCRKKVHADWGLVCCSTYHPLPNGFHSTVMPERKKAGSEEGLRPKEPLGPEGPKGPVGPQALFTMEAIW